LLRKLVFSSISNFCRLVVARSLMDRFNSKMLEVILPCQILDMILLRIPRWRLDSPLPDNSGEMCAYASRSFCV